MAGTKYPWLSYRKLDPVDRQKDVDTLSQQASIKKVNKPAVPLRTVFRVSVDSFCIIHLFTNPLLLPAKYQNVGQRLLCEITSLQAAQERVQAILRHDEFLPRGHTALGDGC